MYKKRSLKELYRLAKGEKDDCCHKEPFTTGGCSAGKTEGCDDGKEEVNHYCG